MPGSARRVIGVDLGGTKLLAGVLDDGLSVHHRIQRGVGGLDATALLDTVVDAVQAAVTASSGEVDAVGFGIPCLIDQRTGTGVMAVNLPLRDVRFGAIMEERLGLPVFVDNDANLAALAEHRAGAAAGAKEAVVLTVGTGIGDGLILGGELYRGAVGAAGELGHIVIDENGPPCQGNCPGRGCVESLASGTALAREAARLAGEQPGSGLGRAMAAGQALLGPLITELAHDGDGAAREAISLIGARLGVAVTSLVNIFNPQVVVIGGGVIAAGELLLAPARAELARRALSPSREIAEVRAAHFGMEAGMIGAAALALDGIQGDGA